MYDMLQNTLANPLDWPASPRPPFSLQFFHLLRFSLGIFCKCYVSNSWLNLHP
jgi:hypothetical protein